MTCVNLRWKAIVSLAWFAMTTTLLWGQSPSDFDTYKARYPSYPFIRLVDEAHLSVSFDSKGTPQISIKENNQRLLLSDNCNDLSEMRRFYSAKDEFKKLEVYSLVPNNDKYKKLKAPPLKRTTDQDNSTYYDDSYCYVGHYPAVTKGSILCEENQYISHEPHFPYKFFFGDYVPVEKTLLSITFPNEVKLDCRFAGKDSALVHFSEVKEGNYTTYQWSCDRMKEYPFDAMAPPARYYQPHIIINIAEYTVKGKTTRVMGSIEDLHRWEYEKVKNTNRTLSPAVKQLADSITLGCKSSREKAKAIYRWVQNNIKYVAIEDGENGFVPREADLVLSRRYGDCKDKSSLLTALLRAVGESASLACLGSRALPYSLTRYPNIGSSNHLIAIWWDEKGQPVPLDGTSLHLAMDEIPSFIQGKECLIVRGEEEFMVYRIPVDPPAKNRITDSIFVTLDKNRLYGRGVSYSRGETKSTLIYHLDGKSLAQQKEVLSELLSFAGKKMDLDEIEIKGSDTPETALKIGYRVSLPDYATSAANRVYINLNLYQRLSQLDIKADRSIPIESDNTNLYSVVNTFTLPAGYKLVELPEESNYSHPDFGFAIHYRQEQNRIVQTTELSLGFQVIDGEAMSAFREMILKLKMAYRSTVVLEKL